MVATAQKELLRDGVIKAGDVLGVVAGTKLSSGSTNFLRLHAITEQEAHGAVPRRKKA